VFVLLIHQLNTGNLSPAELDWATAQLRAWSRKLTLEAVPRSPEGFFVDVAGKGGLVRRTGNDSGSMLRYLDTTPMAEQLERAIHALRQAEATDQGPAAPINQQRVAILEKVRPAVSPNLNADLRRDPRIAVTVAAKVRVGLGRICRDLAAKDVNEPANEPNASAEQIEVYAVADGPRVKRAAANEHDSLAASISSFSDPIWQVKDRSVAGLRIAASGGIGQSLALGALVAVRQSDVTDWVLGVVRRLNKVSNDEVEAGVSIIAERLVPVVLHAKREAKEDLGIIVNGIDVSTMGARFDGLYLPPPSRPDKPLAVKTLIVPTSEYVEGRNVILTTGRSVYTVALRQLVEQRAEWSWAAIQIVEKKPKEL
jgi:cyclic-di-GMP-binding protein